MQTTVGNIKTYNDLLQSESWKRRRKEILARDGYSCVRCGSEQQLNVHHRQYHIKSTYGGFVNPWAYKSNNLVTLCNRCHQLGHKLFKIPVFNV